MNYLYSDRGRAVRFICDLWARAGTPASKDPARKSRAAAPVAMAVAAGMLVAGCGGREPHPVASIRSADGTLDCAAVSREYAANERQIVSTVKERGEAEGKNIILGATGVLLFWPALFFMDPKSPEKVEIDALRNRNLVLEDIARRKGCGPLESQLKEVYRRMDHPVVAQSTRAGG